MQQQQQNADDGAAVGSKQSRVSAATAVVDSTSVVITAPNPRCTQTSDVTKNQNPRNEGDDVSKLLSAELGQVVIDCCCYRNGSKHQTLLVETLRWTKLSLTVIGKREEHALTHDPLLLLLFIEYFDLLRAGCTCTCVRPLNSF